MSHEVVDREAVFDGCGVARDAKGRPIRPPVAVAPAPRLAELDLNRSPALVAWEATRATGACDLCGTRRRREPEELSTMEAVRLMNDVRRFGPVSFLITGGDPLLRPDLLELVGHGSRVGLRMALALPCAVSAETGLLRRLRHEGLSRVSVRVHGDAVRGGLATDGRDARAVRALLLAQDVGLPTQADTVLTGSTSGLATLGTALAELGVQRWLVAFPTDAAEAAALGAAEAERALRSLHDLDARLPLDVRVVGAPQWQRLTIRAGVPPGPAVRDGRGILFVRYDGEVRPSRHMPLAVGSVRTDDVVEAYRWSEPFRTLRDPAALRGKCAVCEYREVCGGSRARALACTGDMLETDPLCPYVPAGMARPSI